MKYLVKCHLNYLISKTTIIVAFIVLLIILISSLSSVFTLDSKVRFIENNYLYFYDVFMISKIIIVLFAIFLFGYSNLSKSDQYVVILIVSGISRKKIVITKIIAICIVILIVVYIAFIQYVLVGFINFKYFVFNPTYLFSYANLFLLACFFGLISFLLIQKFDNIYTLIIPFALMNLSEVINDEANIIVIVINFILPNFNHHLNFYYGSKHIIILIIICLVVNIYYYELKDFKN